MAIVGIGTHAPAVFPGEFAAAQPAASPTVPAQIQVPTPTQDVRAEDLQNIAQGAIDGLKAITSVDMTIAGNKTLSGNTSIGGTLSVTGASTLTGAVTCGSTISFSPAVSITRAQGAPYGITGTWTVDATTAGIVDSDTGNTAGFELQPPHGSLLTAVSVFCTAGAGHIGLPVSMPQITLYKVHGNGAGVTSLGSATDPSLNTTGFEQPHSIVLSSLSHTVDRSAYRYFLKFSAEAGTRALSGMILYYCDCTYSVSAVGLD